jgi:hypothetical protein
VVIGNPPYVLGRETFEESVKRYISLKYRSYGGKYDLYVFFCEKALSLLNIDGKFSFIIPNTILANENATKIRQIILENYKLETIRVFKNKVFENAQVETVIIVIENQRSKINNSIVIESNTIIKIPSDKFLLNKNYKFNVAMDDIDDELLNKISQSSIKLGEITDICIGIQLGGGQGKSTKEDFLSEKANDNTWKKVLDGKDINCYQLHSRDVFVHYGNWLHRKRDEKYFLNPKILIRQIGQTPVATYDDKNYYTLNTIYNLIATNDYSLKYSLAIINSKLGKWFWKKINSDFKIIFPKIKKSEIEAIPICKIDFENKPQNSLYIDILKLVDQLLRLNEDIKESRLQTQIDQIKSKIDYCENRINEIVYQLYGLTEEEVRIVEGR